MNCWQLTPQSWWTKLWWRAVNYKGNFIFIPGNVVSSIVHSMIVVSQLDCSLSVLDWPLVMVIRDVSVDHCTAFQAPQIHGPVPTSIKLQNKIINAQNTRKYDRFQDNSCNRYSPESTIHRIDSSIILWNISLIVTFFFD